MRTATGRWLLLACGLTCAVLGRPGRAEDPQEPKAKERQKVIDRMIQESLVDYKVFADRESQAPLPPHSVLRFVNDTRMLMHGEAVLVLWTNGGRPEALASLYPWGKGLAHEFVTLSRGGGIVARKQDQVLWSPKAPGVTFHEIPDAPSPAEASAARLAQMKALSERFKVTMTGWRPGNIDREDLRILAKPVYRYDLKGESPAPPELIDGSVFAFVLGTDPEAVLLLEAVRTGKKTGWQYALGRATYAGVEARLDGAVVWTALRLPNQHHPESPIFGFGIPIPESP